MNQFKRTSMLLRMVLFFLLSVLADKTIGQVTSPQQSDSMKTTLTTLPAKYLEQVSSKTEKYYNSITSKTEKTLERLSKWESKIKTILEKTNPETAQRLFGNGQLTFAALLQKYKEGKTVADGYKGKYDEYRDKLTTTVKYLDEKKQQLDSHIIKPLATAKANTTKLNEQLKNTEAVEQFIKERKKQLLEQALQYLGKSKYLQKISKESYYYIETLRNYKEIFSDPKKAEETALALLQKIPAFKEFLRKNSMLASLFSLPQTPSEGGGLNSLAGLQTRVQVNNLIQQQIASGGPNAQQQFQQNMQAAQSQLNELKNKILKAGGGSSDANMPEGFEPNNQKSKTFLQRLEVRTNVQTQGARNYFPVTSDLGLSVGYKLNDKSIIGIGASYKLGWGSGWNNIRLTQQGAGIRSFVDWKIKGNFWLSGGYEANYRSLFNSISELRNLNSWQQSGLVGISKSVPIKTKFFTRTKLQLLWDFLSYQQVPRTQPILFRVGYNFK